MPAKINDGGPAYPVSWQEMNINGDYRMVARPGMSLRQHYAGLAMASILQTPSGGREEPAIVAKASALMADAMIKELAP